MTSLYFFIKYYMINNSVLYIFFYCFFTQTP